VRSANKAGTAADASSPPQTPSLSAARRRSHELYCEIDGLPVELDARELSSTGLFVETHLPAAVDTEVEVFIRIGELRFEVSGHVVKSVSCETATLRGTRPGYGLLLTNLDEAERKRLARAIEALERTSIPEPAKTVASQQPQFTEPPTARTQASFEPPTVRNSGFSIPAEALRSAVIAPGKVAIPSYPAQEIMLLGQLMTELDQLAPKTPWAILGVSQGSDMAQAKAAYHAASKRYHPHRFARYAHPEIKRVVTELFIAHKRAYTTMLRAGKSLRAGRP
jgi:hypothetical protein